VLLPLEKGIGPPAGGIYALYYDDSLVYPGKAPRTLTKGHRTLCSVSGWEAMFPSRLLINYLNSQLSIHQIRVIQGFCETDEARFLRIQPFVTNLLGKVSARN